MDRPKRKKSHIQIIRQIQTDQHTKTEKQTDQQTDGQRDRHTERKTNGKTNKTRKTDTLGRYKETNKKRDRQKTDFFNYCIVFQGLCTENHLTLVE